MLPFILGVLLMLIGGLASVAAGKSPRTSNLIGPASTLTGSALGLVTVIRVLARGNELSVRLPWGFPVGSFHIGIDPLSAFFMLPVLVLSSLAAIYGHKYMEGYIGKKPLGAHWFFFNILVSGMCMTLAARDGLLFLISWEIMSLAPFFLVTFEDEKDSVRSAGWIYMLAAHLGAIPLYVLFILLGQAAGSLDFNAFASISGQTPLFLGILFALTITGFGVKAGFIPLHVWLPEAHPAAPSHVSAVMSGVMIKMGIYGILRTMTFLGTPQIWWGETLILIGLASGVMGILFATAQGDLKRLLAYSSVENIGIITLGIGIGVTGRATGHELISALGYLGALMHVINHAIVKGLLFMGAGAVLHETGTVQMDKLGGLHKRMPVTSSFFLAGAAAVSALPPLNVFSGEFIIYIAGINGALGGGTHLQAVALLVLTGIAIIGGLALLCFVKAYGSVFPGVSHKEHKDVHEPGGMMLLPMGILTVMCISLGVFPYLNPALSFKLLGMVSGLSAEAAANGIYYAAGTFENIMLLSVVLILTICIVVLARKAFLRGKSVESSVTWDCGYAAPTERMSYTASSFTQPIMSVMQMIVRIEESFSSKMELFPFKASFGTVIRGGTKDYIFKPVYRWLTSGLSKFRWIQHGMLNIYVLYVAMTLVALLLWKI